MTRPLAAIAAGIWIVIVAATALAHESSSSFLTLRADDREVAGRWDIALRDLDLALGLDTNEDAKITWGELQGARAAVFAYAFAGLRLATNDAPCEAVADALRVDHHGDGAYAVLDFRAHCPGAERGLSVSYSLLFELDARHRGLVRYESGGGSQNAIFADDGRNRRFAATEAHAAWSSFLDFVREGITHIAIGTDHVLFLVSLLLPAVVRREKGRWIPVDSLSVAASDAARVVTAFTAAHSLTLGLATLDLVALPSRWVEATIAASVAIAALHNLVPLFERARARMAFGFGLIHGLGFASVLRDLGLSERGIGMPLLGFNLGVELAQLAGVLVFLPITFLLRDAPVYRQFGLVAGSVAIAIVGMLWFIERAWDLGPLAIRL